MKVKLKVYDHSSRSGREEIKNIRWLADAGKDPEGQQSYLVLTVEDRIAQFLIDKSWGEIIFD